MELDRSLSITLTFSMALLLMGAHLSSASSSSFISDAVLDLPASTGRTLLQARKGCPVNFEFLNYTVITGKCKGPHYSTVSCCSALKDFACPYTDVLNDLTNDCASTMFSYINLYGRYPPGLFASECREGKQGLECPADSPTASADASGSKNAATARSSSSSSSLLLLIPACLVFLLHSF